MPSPEQILSFPGKGLDVTREFGQQPEDTTADCLNVMSRDQIAGRSRGGSRAGVSKYIAGQSLQGSHMIQMLETIVDPTTAALPQNFETPLDTWVDHPRFPDVLIPPGGAPWQPFDGPQPPGKQGSGTITAASALEGEGETPAVPPTCTVHTVTITWAVGWSVSEVTTSFDYCDCDDPVDAVWADDGGEHTADASPDDLINAAAYYAWGVANGFFPDDFNPVGGYDVVDGGAC